MYEIKIKVFLPEMLCIVIFTAEGSKYSQEKIEC